MSYSSPSLVFTSSKFVVEDGEDEETNPGLFGKALACWIGQSLVPGFRADDVIAEDFGWLVSVPDPNQKLYVACVSTDGSTTEWNVFVFAEGGWFGRLLGRFRPEDSVLRLYDSLKALLESSHGISALREEE